MNVKFFIGCIAKETFLTIAAQIPGGPDPTAFRCINFICKWISGIKDQFICFLIGAEGIRKIFTCIGAVTESINRKAYCSNNDKIDPAVLSPFKDCFSHSQKYSHITSPKVPGIGSSGGSLSRSLLYEVSSV